jgi:hypothetical protein
MRASTRNRGALTIRLGTAERKRIGELAARSETTLERWVELAISAAAHIDEAHWRELEQRDAIRAELSTDRSRFLHLSRTFQGMSDGVFRVLVDEMVAQREKGRREGSESALRLAAVRKVNP